MKRLFKALGVLFLALVVAVLALASPALYVEAFCHAPVEASVYTPLIVEPERQRREANTFLTYPEWHIVYAYDGLAETLKTGDEYEFDYWETVRDFWIADCALTRVADMHGGADADTRRMVATIGISFSLEMGLKAAYEETFGHLTAWWRGPQKTSQDLLARDMAADYAAFLRQVPWYKYPFSRPLDQLRALPVDGVRGLERKLALGGEWRAKIAYAGAIAGAVEATGQAQLTIFSVITGLSPDQLAAIDDVKIISSGAEGVVIETPRYDRFTHILAEAAQAGGNIREIAGNDDIMVTLTAAPDADTTLQPKGELIARLPRTGFSGERLITSVKVQDLADLLRQTPIADPGVEHVFDY